MKVYDIVICLGQEVLKTMTLKAKTHNLKTIRIKSGMSIRALSKAAGLSSATVFKIENKETPPLPSTAKKICTALGASFDDLFEIVEKGC